MANNLEYMCLNQFIKPKYYISVNGAGNCLHCIRHPDNKYCKNYNPIPYRKIKGVDYRMILYKQNPLVVISGGDKKW